MHVTSVPAATLVGLDAGVLLPVLAPAAGALVVLVLDAAAPRLRGAHAAVGTLALLVGAGAALLPAASGRGATSLCRPGPDPECLYVVTPAAAVLQVAALLASVLVLLLLWPVRGTSRWRDELAELRGGPALLVTLLLAATAGAVAVAGARDLASWLVALELATLPVVALVALRGSRRAGPGALALLTTSLFSFGLLVVGAALWVAATGRATFAADAARQAWATGPTRAALVLSVLVLLAGLAFKLSAVPFHLWTPQAYTASREPVAALLATTSKLGAVAALVVLLRPLAGLGGGAGPLPVSVALGLLAAASMTLGNVLALGQQDPVRLLAWSTVAQAGWVLLPMAALTGTGLAAGAGYAVVYALATVTVFAVVVLVHARRPVTAGVGGTGGVGGASGPAGTVGRAGTADAAGAASLPRSLADYRGLARTDPLLAGVLALGLLSLAGLPPGVVGLLAKVLAVRPVVDGGLWVLAGVAVLNAVLGIAVYIRWVAVLFAPREGREPVGQGVPGVRIALGLGAAGLLVTSLAPQVLLGLLGP